MFRNCLSLCIVVPIFAAVFALHGYASEKCVDLTEAINIAMEQNHEIRAFKHALSAHKEDIGIARSYLLPKIAFEERAVRTNNPPGVFMAKLNQERFSQADFDIHTLNSPKPITDLQTLFSIEQPLFVGKTFIGLSMAKKAYSAQSEYFNRKREEIALKVAQAYLDVHTAKEHASVAQKALEDAREHMRISEIRYKNGLGLYSDVLRTKTAVAEAEQRIVSTQKNMVVSKRMLGLLLGSSDAVDTGPGTVEIPFMDMDYYTSASLSRRDIKALQLQSENAKNSVKLAESQYLPTIGVGGAYQLNDHTRIFGSEGESWRLMATFRWELFDGTNREYQRSKALFKAAETESRLKGLKQYVAFKIHEAYLAVEEAGKNVELSQAALRTAEEGKRLVKTRFENSLSPVIDLLDVQLNLDHTRARAVTRQNEYRLSIINLSYESGTILKDLNIK